MSCRYMKQSIVEILKSGGDPTLLLDDEKPAVLMMVGVNGGGKTTSIGWSHNLKENDCETTEVEFQTLKSQRTQPQSCCRLVPQIMRDS